MLMAKATLEWNLWVDCPYCFETMDLSDMDEEGCYSKPIFNNKWDELRGKEVECIYCTRSFGIESVEY